MKRKRELNGKLRCMKMTLNRSLLANSPYRHAFVQWVTEQCHTATIITVLSSLLFLFKNNYAFDKDDYAFFTGSGYKTIENCFLHVLDDKQREHLPDEFRRIITRAVPNFRWPQRKGMGNAFNLLVEQYKTNVKNNIRIWAYSRIKKFFKLKQFELNLFEKNVTDIDVKNATKCVMFNNIAEKSENVEELLTHAQMIGVPVGQKFIDIVNGQWFRTIPIFIHIQRQIFNHHERYEWLNDLWRQYWRDPRNKPKPTVERPPKIQNFRVIPLHDFKMKHIRIDIHLFYEIASKLGALKFAKGFRGQPVNISKETYYNNAFAYWGQIFNMDKIERIGNGREFDYAIVTDSVDVSLCFVKPESESNDLTNEQIKDMYEKGVFEFVLGMDPGVRTWNATVRRHIQSQVEVRMNELIVCSLLFCLF